VRIASLECIISRIFEDRIWVWIYFRHTLTDMRPRLSPWNEDNARRPEKVAGDQDLEDSKILCGHAWLQYPDKVHLCRCQLFRTFPQQRFSPEEPQNAVPLNAMVSPSNAHNSPANVMDAVPFLCHLYTLTAMRTPWKSSGLNSLRCVSRAPTMELNSSFSSIALPLFSVNPV